MKQNLLKIMVVLACLVLVACVFAACGSQEEAPENTDAEVAEVAEGETEAEASGSTGALIGSWKYAGGDYTYNFNADGTGNYTVGETVMEFTYEDDGATVTIQYATATVPNEYAYTVEGNTLYIADDFGDTVEYHKQ